MALIIRQATFEDKEKIFRFLWEAYGGLAFFKFPERWRWLFEDNPFDNHKGPCVWLALSNGKIVGQYCGMHVFFKLGSKIHPAVWGLDFIVHPDYRGGMIGWRLLKTFLQNHHYFLGIWTTPVAEGLYFLCGAKVPVYASVFEMKVKQEPTFLAEPNQNNIEIYQIFKFGREVNELWRSASSHYHGSVKRDAKYLNWKFMQQPHAYYRAFIAKTGKDTHGYVILRKARLPEDNVGLIADLFASPKDLHTIRALIHFSIRYFKSKKVHSIVTAASMHSMAHCLTQLGFRKVKEIPFLMLSSHRQEKFRDSQSQSWFLSRGDSDWDQYPLLRSLSRSFVSK